MSWIVLDCHGKERQRERERVRQKSKGGRVVWQCPRSIERAVRVRRVTKGRTLGRRRRFGIRHVSSACVCLPFSGWVWSVWLSNISKVNEHHEVKTELDDDKGCDLIPRWRSCPPVLLGAHPPSKPFNNSKRAQWKRVGGKRGIVGKRCLRLGELSYRPLLLPYASAILCNSALCNVEKWSGQGNGEMKGTPGNPQAYLRGMSQISYSSSPWGTYHITLPLFILSAQAGTVSRLLKGNLLMFKSW